MAYFLKTDTARGKKPQFWRGSNGNSGTITGSNYNFGEGSFGTSAYTEFTTNGGGADDLTGLPGYTNQVAGTDVMQLACDSSGSTDTIATITGATINGTLLGNFAANTTYTFTVLLVDSQGNSSAGDSTSIEILNGGASSGVTAQGSMLATTTASYSMLSTSAQSSFTSYSVTFDTATMPSLVSAGDYIQLAFVDTQATGGGQINIDFDNPTLTASADSVPEPSIFTLALAGLVVGVMVFAVRRGKSRLTSPAL